jgi:aminotransferase
MTARNYQICMRCVMDTSDIEISFDAHGHCNHCTEFEQITRKRWFPNDEGARRWDKTLADIKRAGHGRDYDCILGLSGGVDSSYLALKARDWNLRPLVVHVDAGWNAELAVANIEAVVKHCNYDLHTHVVDWDEMRDLQVAFLRAGVPNQDVPQDHVFFASLFNFAMKHGIRYVLSGGNIATESIFPLTWQASAMDAINLKAIHRAYGERPLSTFSLVSFFDYYIGYPYLKGMRILRPLDYLNYNKDVATAELEQAMGWRSYGRKHGESLFTKLFQNYYLPKKFGYDKRRPHLASLIVSGQMTREQALIKLEEPLYDPHELQIDIAYFCKKLRISKQQFEQFLADPPRRHEDFASWKRQYAFLKVAQSSYQKLTGRRMSYG